MTDGNDMYLWASFKAGNKNSFRLLYDLYYEKLYKYGLRITHAETVKDAIHDLFVKLWCNKQSLRDVEQVLPYLMLALRNTLMNKMEKQSKIELAQVAASIEVSAAERDYHSKKLLNEDHYRVFSIIFEKLTSRQKEFIHLYYLEGLSYDEVAAILELSIKATYKLAARAIATIKQGLTPPEQQHLMRHLKLFLSFC